MNKSYKTNITLNPKSLSRRSMLKAITATAAYTALSPFVTIPLLKKRQPNQKADPRAVNARDCIIDAFKQFPIVAIGERHCIQEVHDFFTALLFDRELPDLLTDIVVEFGNAQHQDYADRFILENLPLSKAELQQLWRYTIGGGVLWDAPVYEQFFLTVHAINWMRPPHKRLRVLLGDPPCDPARIQEKSAKTYVQNLEKERDKHYAEIVEREVLNKGRRALLIAGSGHLLRGIQDNFNQPNAVSL